MRFEILCYDLFMQMFESRSAFESTLSSYVSQFEHFADSTSLTRLLLLSNSLLQSNTSHYFQSMKSSYYWALLMSFKNYIFKVRIIHMRISASVKHTCFFTSS